MSLRTTPLIDASVGEQEQDANSALTELDKGLRSSKVGEQCEAIVRFPRLFEKYPFPILINSSFLKLSDVFRMGNNFLRLWVLRVCQQSEKHLDKILNVDEFLRRVFSVLHSNDSVARALALRTLGAVAGIIPERENVHHAIRKGLESHDDVEVEAAIYATTRFAKHSSTFAVAICDKLSDMVECENTGAERRDKLIYALRTVHGKSIFGAQRVLKLLSSLMEKFPSSSSVKAAINSITFIASDTVLHVPEQVEVLLSIAVNDGRASVRRSALLGLRQLAVHAALWTPDSVQSLVLAAAANRNVAHTQLCLQVMRTLVKCPGICSTAGSIQRNRDGNPEPSLLRQYCYEAALSVEPYVAAIAAQVLTDIVVHCYKECLPVEGADLMLALESLVVATGLSDEKDYTKPLRIALKCMVDLCTVEPLIYAERTSRILGHQLSSCDWITDSSTQREVTRLESILEAMGALGGSTYCPKSIQPAMPAVVDKLQYRAEMAKDSMASDMDTDQPECAPNKDGTALVLLCTIACQERAGVALTCDISDEWEQLVTDALADSDAWTVYRVARAALRYAHHGLGAKLLSTLVPIAPTEPAKRWLTALHKAASADHMLDKEGLSGVDECAGLWRVAADCAGAAGWCGSCGGCDSCSGTSSSWLAARCTGLWAISRVCVAARALCTQPPPAVAHAHAQANREPCTRAGAVCSSLVRASRSVRQAAEKYALIARTAFHADNATLRHLNIIQHNYNLLSQFLERITCSNYQEKQAIEISFSSKELKATNLEEKILLNISKQLQKISDTLFNDPSTKPGITHRHVEGVLAACKSACRGVGWAVGGVGGGAGGRCRLSLSPAPPTHSDTHPLNTHHHLALHVDGVILPPTHTHRKRKQERQVKGVQLTVTVTPHPRSSDKSVDLTNVPPLSTAVQTVAPVRDFFSAQQLISVQNPGLYTVAVEAAFIDEKADLWLTGTKSSIVVKAHEDQVTKGTTQTARRF